MKLFFKLILVLVGILYLNNITYAQDFEILDTTTATVEIKGVKITTIDIHLDSGATLYIKYPTSLTFIPEFNYSEVQKDTTLHIEVNIGKPFFLYNQSAQFTPFLFFPGYQYNANVKAGQRDLYFLCKKDTQKQTEANALSLELSKEINIFFDNDKKYQKLWTKNKYTKALDSFFVSAYNIRYKEIDSLLAVNVISGEGSNMLHQYVLYNLINERLRPFNNISSTGKLPILPQWYTDTMTQYVNIFKGPSYLPMFPYLRDLYSYDKFLSYKLTGKVTLAEMFANVAKYYTDEDDKNYIYGNIMIPPTFHKDPNYKKYIDSFNVLCTSERSKKILMEQLGYEHKIETTVAEGTVIDINGHLIPLEKLLQKHSKNTYLECWASWCAPCVVQLEKLKDYLPQIPKDSISLIYISFDESVASWKAKMKAFPFMNKSNSFLMSKGFDSDFAKKYRINTIPRHFLFDKSGIVIDDKAPDIVKGK